MRTRSAVGAAAMSLGALIPSGALLGQCAPPPPAFSPVVDWWGGAGGANVTVHATTGPYDGTTEFRAVARCSTGAYGYGLWAGPGGNSTANCSIDGGTYVVSVGWQRR